MCLFCQSLATVQLTIYGVTAATVVGLMLLSMLTCTIMLIAIMKYDSIERNPPFAEFWRSRCEDDWVFAYQCFTTGVPMFLVVVSQVGWVIFSNYDDESRNVASSFVTVIALGTAVWWFVHINPKWVQWNGRRRDTSVARSADPEATSTGPSPSNSRQSLTRGV